MPNIGIGEIAIVLVIALLIFGPKKLPELGRSLGRGLNEFRDGLQSIGDDPADEDDDGEDAGAEDAAVAAPPVLEAGEDREATLPGDEPEVTEVTPNPAGAESESATPADGPAEGVTAPDGKD